MQLNQQGQIQQHVVSGLSYGAGTHPHNDPTSQASDDWYKSAVYVSWKAGQDDTRAVTVCIWSCPERLDKRLQRLCLSPEWNKVLRDPFIILCMAADELYIDLEEQARRIFRAFGAVEKSTLALASSPEQRVRAINFDFQGLSNISKHVLHMSEGAVAAQVTVNAIIDSHERLKKIQDMTVGHHWDLDERLRHKLHLFKSVGLQLSSLEKRTQNLTNLAFNIVAQRNNQIVIDDNQSMKALTFAALVILPINLLAVSDHQYVGVFPTRECVGV